MSRRVIRVVIVSVLFLAGGPTAIGAPPGGGAPAEPAGDRPAGTIAFSSLAPRVGTFNYSRSRLGKPVA